jgi:hypothetical protein
VASICRAALPLASLTSLARYHGFTTFPVKVLTVSSLLRKIKATDAGIFGKVLKMVMRSLYHHTVCIITAFTTALSLVFNGRNYVYIFIAAGFLCFFPLFMLLGGMFILVESRSDKRMEA